MKPCLFAISAALMWAQSATTTYQADLNGNRVAATSSTSSDHTQTDLWQSMNGTRVPLSQTTERVVKDEGGVKVTERIVKKFDPTGRIATSERVVIEETKLPGGGSTVRESTYRADVSGNTQQVERKTIETRVQGTTRTTQTTVDRPSIAGSLEVAEKRSLVTEGPETNQRSTESVYQPDGNGSLHEALRSVKTVVKEGDRTSETSADYAPGVTGQMQIAKQSVTSTTKRPDGSEQSEVTLYAPAAAGRAYEAGAPLAIKEQDIIDRRTNPDGSVVETVSARMPSITSPNTLGALKQVSETICTGKCVPDKPAPATPKPVAENSRP